MPASTSSFAPCSAAPPCDGAVQAIAARAFTLRPLRSDERLGVCRDEAGVLIDGLLTRVARGHAALDLALGEALSTLAEDDRVLRLGFSNVRDYARERLGIGGGVAQGLVRLARELRGRPVLGAAVRSGEITVRQAQTVLPVAHGEEECGWVERARGSTVRQIEKAVREPEAAAVGGWGGDREIPSPFYEGSSVKASVFSSVGGLPRYRTRQRSTWSGDEGAPRRSCRSAPSGPIRSGVRLPSSGHLTAFYPLLGISRVNLMLYAPASWRRPRTV